MAKLYVHAWILARVTPAISVDQQEAAAHTVASAPLRSIGSVRSGHSLEDVDCVFSATGYSIWRSHPRPAVPS